MLLILSFALSHLGHAATRATDEDISSIKSILKVLDDNSANPESKLTVFVDDLIHMANDHEVITTKAELGRHLEENDNMPVAT